MHPFFLTCTITIILTIFISLGHGQDQGGGSTQVTGLRLKRETSERDLKDLNAAINAPPGRGRKRRQLFGLKPTLPISVPSLNLNSNANSNTKPNTTAKPNANPVNQLTNAVSGTTGLLTERIKSPVNVQAQNAPPTITTSTTSAYNTSSEENGNEDVTEKTGTGTGTTETTGKPVNPETTQKTQAASMLFGITNLLNKVVVKPVTTLTKTTYTLLTDVQRKFVKVNQDFFSALNFYNSEQIQNNPVLKESVIVKQEGVECEDVCDPDGPGFGLLGLCTPNYCTCFDPKGNGTEWSLKEERCKDDEVFDPHPEQLSCRNPADTVLCGDPK